MENNSIIEQDKNAAKIVRNINIGVTVLMALLCFSRDLALFSFIIGMFAGLGNFIAMIVFIAQGKTNAYVTCIISMLLLPIIGFGCCSIGAQNVQI